MFTLYVFHAIDIAYITFSFPDTMTLYDVVMCGPEVNYHVTVQ